MNIKNIFASGKMHDKIKLESQHKNKQGTCRYDKCLKNCEKPL